MHQPPRFTQTQVPKDQIWNLIKVMPLSAPWYSFQLGKERGLALKSCSPGTHGSAVSRSLAGPAPFLGHRAGCVTPGFCILPLTVTKPLTLYTTAHCNEMPLKSTVQLFIRENDCSSNITGERTNPPLDNSPDHSVPSESRSYLNF